MSNSLNHVEGFINDHACPVCGKVGAWESMDHSMWEGFSRDLCLNCGSEVVTGYTLVRTALGVFLPGVTQDEPDYSLVDQEAFRQKCVPWDFNKENAGSITYASAEVEILA